MLKGLNKTDLIRLDVNYYLMAKQLVSFSSQSLYCVNISTIYDVLKQFICKIRFRNKNVQVYIIIYIYIRL